MVWANSRLGFSEHRNLRHLSLYNQLLLRHFSDIGQKFRSCNIVKILEVVGELTAVPTINFLINSKDFLVRKKNKHGWPLRSWENTVVLRGYVRKLINERYLHVFSKTPISEATSFWGRLALFSSDLLPFEAV